MAAQGPDRPNADAQCLLDSHPTERLRIVPADGTASGVYTTSPGSAGGPTAETDGERRRRLKPQMLSPDQLLRDDPFPSPSPQCDQAACLHLFIYRTSRHRKPPSNSVRPR